LAATSSRKFAATCAVSASPCAAAKLPHMCARR
jgi:hypothetical protein